MKNRWACLGDKAAQWDADLSAMWSRPETMLEWVRQTVIAAEHFEVMRVQEATSLAYRRERNGSPLPLLEELFSRSRTVDLFYFTEPTDPVNGVWDHSRLSGRIAYFDEGGVVREEEVEQLGSLLVRYRADAIARGALISPRPPLLAGGPQICFSNLKLSRGMFNPQSVHVYFSTSSDIWQPWVQGRLELDREPDARFDNRPLAERHTLRLNAFFERVRHLTLEMGGEWRYAPDVSALDWTHLYWDHGVRMEG